MGTLNIVRVRKVGPVQVSSVNAVADAGGAQRWPDESFDRLADERLFRLLLTAQVTWHRPTFAFGTFSQNSIELTGPDSSGSDTSSLIWERYQFQVTTDPVNLQGTETMATVNRFQSHMAAQRLAGLLIPPGFALTIGCNGEVADNCQLQAMVALSADPYDLAPFIGARTGGIAETQ